MRSPAHAETGVHPSWVRDARAEQCDAERWIQSHTGREIRGWAPCCGGTRDDWCSVGVRGADRRRWPHRHPPAAAGRSMAAFSADAHLSRFPIKIPQLETGDFVRTHAESREQEHNRVVAPPDRRPAIETGEQLTHLLVPDRARDRGHRPIRHGGHRGGQVHRHRRRDSAGSAGRNAARWSGAGRVSGAAGALGAGRIARHHGRSGGRAHGSLPNRCVEKSVNERDVIDEWSHRRQRALVAQVVFGRLCLVLDRRQSARRDLLRGVHAWRRRNSINCLSEAASPRCIFTRRARDCRYRRGCSAETRRV